MEFSGERGQGARKPRNAREMDGERAGEEGKLTNATETEGTARNAGATRGRRRAPAAVLCAREQRQRHGRMRWGRRETARARVLQDIRGAGHREIVGAGERLCGSTAAEKGEREGTVWKGRS